MTEPLREMTPEEEASQARRDFGRSRPGEGFAGVHEHVKGSSMQRDLIHPAETGAHHTPAVEDVELGHLMPSPVGQRPLSAPWVEFLVRRFDRDKLGMPLVSHRDGCYFVVDGQHRLAALRALGAPATERVTCEVYHDLSETDEAELFLGRNFRRPVAPMASYVVAVRAGRPTETGVAEVMASLGLKVGPGKVNGVRQNVSCVRLLSEIHDRLGPDGLRLVGRVLRDAYGLAGFEVAVVEGVALVVQRYGAALEEEGLTAALRGVAGGVAGLISAAEMTRTRLGQSRARSVAATVVDAYNRPLHARATGRLAPWWSGGGRGAAIPHTSNPAGVRGRRNPAGQDGK